MTMFAKEVPRKESRVAEVSVTKRRDGEPKIVGRPSSRRTAPAVSRRVSLKVEDGFRLSEAALCSAVALPAPPLAQEGDVGDEAEILLPAAATQAAPSA